MLLLPLYLLWQLHNSCITAFLSLLYVFIRQLKSVRIYTVHENERWKAEALLWSDWNKQTAAQTKPHRHPVRGGGAATKPPGTNSMRANLTRAGTEVFFLSFCCLSVGCRTWKHITDFLVFKRNDFKAEPPFVTEFQRRICLVVDEGCRRLRWIEQKRLLTLEQGENRVQQYTWMKSRCRATPSSDDIFLLRSI